MIKLLKRFWRYITLSKQQEVKPITTEPAFITRIDVVGSNTYFRVQSGNYSTIYSTLEEARQLRDKLNSTNIPFRTETRVE